MLPKLPAALHWARAPRQPGPLARRRVARPNGARGQVPRGGSARCARAGYCWNGTAWRG